MIRLPCKIGDEIYELIPPFICDEEVDSFHIYEDKILIRTGKRTTDYVNIKEIGKTLFLTKAEAEAKLKELQNEK